MNSHEQLDYDFPTIEYEQVLYEKPTAIFFRIKNVDVWIATSQIEDLDVVEKSFNIPRWLAIGKGLINDEL